MEDKKKSFSRFVKRHPIFVNFIAICITFIALCIAVMIGLGIFTEHGEYKTVPDVRRAPIDEAISRLSNAGFRCEITDSTYNDNFPLGSVIEQDPKANSQAKSLRTVYLSVNASSPRLVALPNLNDQSVRQGESTLNGLGFKNVTITRVPSRFKDLILSISANGREITSGMKLPLSAHIVLTVGDGNEIIENTDSTTGLDDLGDINMDNLDF